LGALLEVGKLNSTVWQIVLGLVIIAAGLVLHQIVNRGSSTRGTVLEYNDLVSMIENNEVKKATIKETQITGELTNNENFQTHLNNLVLQARIAQDLAKNGATVTFESSSSN
jgi:hypothetical protein